MIRLYLCPVVRDAEGSRVPLAGVVAEGSGAWAGEGCQWSMVDLPGRDQALVWVEGPRGVHDALYHYRSVGPFQLVYLTPLCADRAELRGALLRPWHNLSPAWRVHAGVALARHDLRADGAAVTWELVGRLLRRHLDDQAPRRGWAGAAAVPWMEGGY